MCYAYAKQVSIKDYYYLLLDVNMKIIIMHDDWSKTWDYVLFFFFFYPNQEFWLPASATSVMIIIMLLIITFAMTIKYHHYLYHESS